MRCELCGEEFPEEEMEGDYCIDCAMSILYTEEIPTNIDDLWL